MATETETWTLSLRDMMSGPAAVMTSGLRMLDTAQTMAAASGNALAKIPPPRGADGKFLQKGSDEWKAAIAAAQGGAAAVTSAGQAVGASGRKGAAGMSAFTNASRSLGRSLMISGGTVGKLAGFLSQLGPYGMAAAVAVSVLSAVVDKTVGSMVAMAAKAIEVNEHLGLMSARFAALAGSAAGGRAVSAMVQTLSGQLPFATAQIEQWAAALQRAGLEGKSLEAATRAVAAAAAINPEGGANAATGLFQKLNSGGEEAKKQIAAIAAQSRKGVGPLHDMGLELSDLGGKAKVAKMTAQQLTTAIEAALATKGKDPLAAMGGSWDVILMKAHEGFASLFDALAPAVGPFMASVKSLFGEFSKGGVAINVLKPIITAVFTKLFEWAKIAFDAIHKGFLYMVIGGLTAYIAMRPILKAIADIATSANMLRGAALIFALMALPFVVMAAVMLVVVAIIGVVVGVVLALAAAFVYVVGAVAGFVASLGSAFADAYSAATGAGGSIVDGLIAGVTAGAGAFMAAISGLASQGLAAFKGIFGIASPSKVMLEHGEDNIAGATATGIDKGADKVDASMAKLGTGPKGGPTKGGKDGGGSGKMFTFTNCTFGGGMTETMVRDIFAMVAHEMDAEASEPATS